MRWPSRTPSRAWKPSAGKEQAFIDAWLEFAGWASGRPGAGKPRPARDVRDPIASSASGAGTHPTPCATGRARRVPRADLEDQAARRRVRADGADRRRDRGVRRRRGWSLPLQIEPMRRAVTAGCCRTRPPRSLAWRAVYHEQGSITRRSQRCSAISRVSRRRRHPLTRASTGGPSSSSTTPTTAPARSPTAAAAAGVVRRPEGVPGYTACANQPDAWHQHAPAQPASVHLPHSYNISPGLARGRAGAEARARSGAVAPERSGDGRLACALAARHVLQRVGARELRSRTRRMAGGSGYGVYIDALRAVPAARREP